MTSRAMDNRWPGWGLGSMLGCLLYFAVAPSMAQNLVPNHSFEEYDTCRVVNDVYYPDTGPLGWFSAAGTPDHFLSCLPYATFNSVPYSAFAFQYPQDGECYAGVTTYRAIPPNIREYFMVHLVEPLVIGQQYYASFYVSVGWGGYPSNPLAWLCTSKMGMLFTMQPRQWVLNDAYPVPLNYAHVYSQTMIIDTVGWILVSGSFVADSAYQYIMMGNHFDNVNTDTVHIVTQNGPFLGYVLFDNVCVSVDPEGCPMVVGLHDPESIGSRLYPNPARDRIAVQGITSGSGIAIHDAVGRLQWQGIAAGGFFQLGVGHWAKGMYVLHATHAGRRDSFKFVLIE